MLHQWLPESDKINGGLKMLEQRRSNSWGYSAYAALKSAVVGLLMRKCRQTIEVLSEINSALNSVFHLNNALKGMSSPRMWDNQLTV